MASVGLALGWTLAALAQSAEPAPQGKLVLEARDGTSSTLPIAGLGAGSLADLGAVSLTVAIEVDERTDGPRPPSESVVELVGGDRLLAELRRGDGDRVELGIAGGAALSVEVDAISAIRRPAVLAGRGSGDLERPASGDRLYWSRGGALDRVDGTLEAFTESGVRFDGVLGAQAFPWDEIAALFIEELRDAHPPAGDPDRRVALDLVDGGRLRAELLQLGPTGARLAWRGGRQLALPWSAIREITADDGTVAYLSATAPTRAIEGWPPDDELGMRWPHQLDLAVSGGALRAGGRTWTRGIGVHAPSRLEWPLDGTWKELRGAVAIDDSVLLLPYRGSVEFAIYLDEAAEPVWRSGRVHGGDAPLAIPKLALTGVERIALVVEMDERAYVADRADWLRMLLVR